MDFCFLVSSCLSFLISFWIVDDEDGFFWCGVVIILIFENRIFIGFEKGSFCFHNSGDLCY